MSESNNHYAEALFALATECGQQAGYLQALEETLALLQDAPDYVELLRSPAIPKGERQQALEAVLQERVPEQVASFLYLLCEHGRIQYLADCVSDFRRRYEEATRVSTAVITTPIPLTDSQCERLQQRLEQLYGGTVRLEQRIDEALLGGITVELDGKVLDGSLRHRLHDMKEVMKQ